MEDRGSDLNRYEAALLYYEEAVQRDPENAEAHYYRGRAYWLLNRHEDAIAAWKEALRLQPDHAHAHSCLTQAGVEVPPLPAPAARRTRSGTAAGRASLKQRIQHHADGFDFQALLEGVSLMSEPGNGATSPASEERPSVSTAKRSDSYTLENGFARVNGAAAPPASEPEKRSEPTPPPAPRRSRGMLPAGVGLCLVLAAGAVYSLNSHSDSATKGSEGGARNMAAAPSTGTDPKTLASNPSTANPAASTTARPNTAAASDHSHKTEPPAPTAKPVVKKIAVYIGGAVQKPGVYSLLPKTHVSDAIITAGGTTKDADLTGVNLVARLDDGQKIVIPVRKAPVAVKPTASATAPTVVSHKPPQESSKPPAATSHTGEMPQNVRITLTAPENGANQHGRTCSVTGTTNLPNGTALNLVVVTKDGMKWPQDSHPVVSEGTFYGSVYLGEDTLGIGEPFEIYAETASGKRSTFITVHRVD